MTIPSILIIFWGSWNLGPLCGRTDRTGLDTGLTKKQLTDANITGNVQVRSLLSHKPSSCAARSIFYVFRWPKRFSAHLSPHVSFLLGKAPPRFRQLPFRGRRRGFLIRVCLMLAKVFFILNFFPESALWKDLGCHLERGIGISTNSANYKLNQTVSTLTGQTSQADRLDRSYT